MASDLDATLDVLRSATGLDVTVSKREVARGSTRADALAAVTSPVGTTDYVVEVRRTVTTSTLPAITNQLERLAQAFGRAPLLLAPHLTPGVTERLVARGFEFADRSGNAYLSSPAAYVLVLGRRAGPDSDRQPATGLTATALILVYALLADRRMWKASFRDLREATGVSLGKISATVKQLGEAGYVSTTASRGRHVLEPLDLLDRWDFGYLEQLRPSLKPSRWALRAGDQLGDVTVRLADRPDVLVGGEAAAATLTHYLEPTTVALHVPPGATNEVAARLRLRPDPHDGPVTILERFVPVRDRDAAAPQALDETPDPEQHLAHPILVRAELLTHDDPRLRKTAGRLLDELIRPELTADERR